MAGWFDPLDGTTRLQQWQQVAQDWLPVVRFQACNQPAELNKVINAIQVGR
ncbi:MAG: hypothetical protein Q9210_003813 [Variospora velana]